MEYDLNFHRHHPDSRSRSPDLGEHYTRVQDHDDYHHHHPHHHHRGPGGGGGPASAATAAAAAAAAPGGAHHQDRDTNGTGSLGASNTLTHHHQPHQPTHPPLPQPMQHQQGPHSANTTGSVVFVTNLSSRTTAGDLEAVFSKYGPLNKVSMITDPHTRESRGFAFVNFDTPDGAGHAVQNANGIELHGRPIKAEIARSNRPRTPTPGRYVGDEKRRPRDSYPPMRRPVAEFRESYREPYRGPYQDPYAERDPYRRRRYSPPPQPVAYAPPARYTDRYAPAAREPYMASRNVYDRRTPPPQPPVYADDRLYDRRPSPRPYYSPAPAASYSYDHYSRPPRY